MKFFYKGADITKQTFLNRCEVETFAEKHADTMLARFDDSAGLWDSWSPAQGDEVRFEFDNFETGAMFVKEIKPENGLMTIFASSMPLSCYTRNTRTWEDIRFLRLCQDIAEAHGMGFQSYDVTDQLYRYIQQDTTGDLEFLNRRCQLEGCALVVFDNTIIVYNEAAREGSEPTEKLKLGKDAVFRYYDRSAGAFGAAEIISGSYHGLFNAPSGDKSRVFRPSKEINCMDNTEALRFSCGLLRQVNKDTVGGSFRRKLTPEVAAGSVIEIETEKAKSWGGKIFVTKTRHDFVKNESKIYFRKPLEGY